MADEEDKSIRINTLGGALMRLTRVVVVFVVEFLNSCLQVHVRVGCIHWRH